MSNVGKRVRGKCQGQTEEMRMGTIIHDSDGICVIEWDNEKVTGAVLSSVVDKLDTTPPLTKQHLSLVQ